MKVCCDCKHEKPLEEFPKHKNRKDGRGTRCKLCQSEYGRIWYQKNWAKKNEASKTYYDIHKERFRETGYRNKYGITIQEYERLLEKQNGRCAICQKLPEGNSKCHWTKTPRRLCVDHDHKSGRVRGLLCRQCNYSLGCWGDSIEGIMKVIEYLKGGDA